jgi:hypothetical protein
MFFSQAMSDGTATPAADYIGKPARSPLQVRLRQAFMAGKRFSVGVGNALRAWRDPGVQDVFPVNTLRKLEMAARIHFAAGCSLLYEDWMAYGAEGHLRPLLDLYAHVAWIRDKGGLQAPMTAAGRARCYELGMVWALLTEARELRRDDAAVWVTRIGNALQAFDAVHTVDRCTCKGRGRGYREVRRTLVAMATAAPAERLRRAESMLILWRSTSRLIHHSGFERMTRFDGTRSWIGPAEPIQRAQAFLQLVEVYGSILGWVVEMHSEQLARQLVTDLDRLCRASVVTEALNMMPSRYFFPLRQLTSSIPIRRSLARGSVRVRASPTTRPTIPPTVRQVTSIS